MPRLPPSLRWIEALPLALERCPGVTPVNISCFPGESLPLGHEDLRPVLQRPGLALLAWSIWEQPAGPRYVVNWITSGPGPARRLASRGLGRDELPHALPVRRGDKFYDAGIYGGPPLGAPGEGRADYVYFAAAPHLPSSAVPRLIGALRLAGIRNDFEAPFCVVRGG